MKKLEEVEKVDTIQGRGKKKEYIANFNGDDSFYENFANIAKKNKWIVYKINQKTTSLEDVFYQLTHEVEDK